MPLAFSASHRVIQSPFAGPAKSLRGYIMLSGPIVAIVSNTFVSSLSGGEKKSPSFLRQYLLSTPPQNPDNEDPLHPDCLDPSRQKCCAELYVSPAFRNPQAINLTTRQPQTAGCVQWRRERRQRQRRRMHRYRPPRSMSRYGSDAKPQKNQKPP